jgi:SAM-dependent methyltransferase
VTAAAFWAEALRSWAIPDEILAAAPESPWGFPVSVFVDMARETVSGPWTPTVRRAAEALPERGTVLDVGSGAGTASLPLAAHAGRIIAVDEDPGMLSALTSLAAGQPGSVVPETIAGRWPDVADRVERVDVAVCANVAYNVPDLAPFASALTSVARTRVVLELTAVHPLASLSPLWERFWGLTRPDRPVVEDALAVIRETTGATVGVERWERPQHRPGLLGEGVDWTRRRLCLPERAEPEVAEALRQLPEQAGRAMVTLWWEPT